MRGIEADGDQQRTHLGLEILAHPGALGRIAIAVRDDRDALAGEGGREVVVVEGVLPLDQLVREGRKLLEAAHRGRTLGLARERGRQVIRRAHLEPLVQVGRDDGQEAQALQQRNAWPLGPVQHPFVEGEDAVVTVEEGKHRRGGVAHGDVVRMTGV